MPCLCQYITAHDLLLMIRYNGRPDRY